MALKIRQYIALVTLFSLPSGLAYAGLDAIEEPAPEMPSLIVLSIPTLLNENKTGSYSGFLNYLQSKNKIASWTVAPTRRAERIFLEKGYDCIAPVDLDFITDRGLDPQNFTMTSAFNNAVAYLYFTDQQAMTKSVPKIGSIGVMAEGQWTREHFEHVRIPNYFRLLSMVNHGSLDAALVTFPDILEHGKAYELVLKLSPFREAAWQGAERIICHKQAGEAVVALSKEIDALITSGAMDELIENKYIHPAQK
ncbi:hypothetical protein QGN29_08040 [Temperatibacter marinus]|uniref:Solute-binding protein family 3/N-terminal domain-containing protein n=1 Tax=Temperatibacter marinus TaxID=1456591 RepID=A0AA52H863_9PROT|nr:hypothetical protein [Temperatibacter marinus]WND01509.1 hypothetical protein QGN29_08040 [Temperatibacter marinus]